MTEAERIASAVAAGLPHVKAGSLRFWGCWFGRPYDNVHRIRSASADGDVLLVSFADDELLTVWTPGGATITADVFAVLRAERVRWEWFYYGRPKVPGNRYFQDFRGRGDISVDTNIDWYQPTFEVDPALPAVEIL